MQSLLKHPPSPAAAEASGQPAVSAKTLGKALSPAQFFKSCSPKTDNDRTLLATYFLEKHRDAQSSTASEIRDLIRDAKVPPPRNPNDSINQNIRKGLLMTAGEKANKMAFVVTSDGEAVVEAMQTKRQD